MDISLFSYMYTLFLAFGCYSFLNPASARSFVLKTIICLAKYTITGYGFFKEYVYRPYVKYLHPKLLRLLHIDDGINEIVVIRNGKIIHSFKTMELFVKNNPIKFVKEFSDNGDDEEQEQEQEEEQDTTQENVTTSATSDLSDKVDYNKKCEQINELIEAFKLHSLDDKSSPPSGVVVSEQHQQESTTENSETNNENNNNNKDNEESQENEENEDVDAEEEEDTDKSHEESDDTPDDYILDPTAYDFIIRNFYYEDEKTGQICSYVFKYDIFYKSEMHEKYDVAMVKDKYFSSRKFIGISLKTNNQKYNINLTTPNNYYVSDNSILNYSFMKWYMLEHYNVKLSQDYVISCIDNYVEMYKINPGKKIFVHKNRLEVVDDETFINEDIDNDECDEDESEVDSETDTEDKAEHENKNECQSIHLEDSQNSHEMCDIEILDYD